MNVRNLAGVGLLVSWSLLIFSSGVCQETESKNGSESAVQEKKDSEEGRVNDEEFGFSFIPPKDWKKFDSPTRGKLSTEAFLNLMGQSDGVFASNVNVRAIPTTENELKNLDLRDHCDEFKTVLSQRINEWALVSESYDDVDNKKAAILTATCMVGPDNSIKLQQFTCIIADAPNSFILTFTVREDCSEELKSAVIESFKSVQVKDP